MMLTMTEADNSHTGICIPQKFQPIIC